MAAQSSDASMTLGERLSKIAIPASVVVTIVAAIVIAFIAAPPTGVREAAAAVALVGSIAIGIERAFEVFWTVVDLDNRGWPFGFLTKSLRDLEAKAEPQVTKYVTEAQDFLTRATTGVPVVEAKFTDLKKDLEEAKSLLATLKGLSASNATQNTLNSVTAWVQRIQQTIPPGEAVLATGRGVLEVLDNVLAKFKDNPGRRFFSLFANMTIGMIICAIFRVDIFNSILGFSFDGFVIGSNTVTFQIGIVVTGLVVGLGSDPAHQVIRLLEEAKGKFKRDNPK